MWWMSRQPSVHAGSVLPTVTVSGVVEEGFSGSGFGPDGRCTGPLPSVPLHPAKISAAARDASVYSLFFITSDNFRKSRKECLKNKKNSGKPFRFTFIFVYLKIETIQRKIELSITTNY
jgi:hypothetical protein